MMTNYLLPNVLSTLLLVGLLGAQTAHADAHLPADPAISTDFLMGQFDPAKRSDFSKISTRYASRNGMYMQSTAYDAFKAMHRDAELAGVKLVIQSAARNFYQQKAIWEGKWDGKRSVGDIRNIQKAIKDPMLRARKILEYSSMPGSSRHHWGTDIDLNAFNNSYFASGTGKRVYDWLVQNAPRYGFCQPYTAKSELRPTGYNEEKWHWSFRPLSQQYTAQSRLRIYDAMFRGFRGSETAQGIGIVENYVLGINPVCR
jgi:LAS superfamily LD-carboxypeptidase LdcB